MRCQACRRELPNLEPVYRIRVGYGSMWTTPFGSSVGSVCNKCEAEQFTYQYLANDGVERLMRNRWLSAKPCCHCQRPVFVDRHQRGVTLLRLRHRVPKSHVCKCSASNPEASDMRCLQETLPAQVACGVLLERMSAAGLSAALDGVNRPRVSGRGPT